jgi:TonB-linked SusC/RagA family outer membrane protein
MRRYYKLLIGLLVVVSVPVGLAAQQTGTITGQVVDAGTGRPLPSVFIQVTGSEARANTDAEGRYTIRGVPPGRRAVAASLLGREGQSQTVTVVAGQAATANFRMTEQATQLDAIVVSAITGRAERKREVGANVSTIAVADIQKGPITRPSDLLQGRTAGVNLSTSAGGVGTSQKIRIRGANSLNLSNEPLIYVDGIQFSNTGGGFGVGGQNTSRLNDINSEDIENIEILKGPAASALYGTAAANGVLLITTKRGRAGRPVWRAYAEFGRNENAVEFPDLYLPVQVNNASLPLYTSAGLINTAGYRVCTNIEAATISATTGQPTCRQDQLFTGNPLAGGRTSPFSTGERNKYGLSVSGGSETVTYFLSADREDETGVISFNTGEKTTVRTNLGAQVRENLTINASGAYIRNNLVTPGGDNNIFSPLINGLLGLAVELPEEVDASFLPRRRPSYGFGLSPEDISNYNAGAEIDRFTGGLNGTYTPFAWLSANANVGLDFFTRHDIQTVQPRRLPIGSPFTEGFRQSRRNNNYLLTGNASARGTFSLASDLVATTTLGASYNRNLFENTYCFGAGIVEGTRSCGATSSQFSVDEDFTEAITVGAFGRQEFAFRDRIFVSASVRGDDNSAFGTDFGFVTYPSASLSWVVSEEPFFPELGFLSNLRLRTAYGTSGLRPNFRDAVTLGAPVSVQLTEGAGTTEASAITFRSIGNVGLRPERSTEYELGFDMGLLNDRLAVEFTYFTKESKDALIRRNIAPSFGLTANEAGLPTGSVFANLGSISNSGTEFQLSARVLESDRMRLNLRFNATTLQSNINELGAGVEPIVFNRGAQRFQEGFTPGGYFFRPFKYADTNGDGKLSQSEVQFDTAQKTERRRTLLNGDVKIDTIPEVFMGGILPTNTQSLGGDVTLFKYLTITSLIERRAGHKQLNATEQFRCAQGYSKRTTSGGAGCSAVSNPNASLEEQARFIAATFLGTNAGFVEDAGFVKWRELAVTLGVPEAISNRFRTLEGASVTVAGRNLKTWTDYSGLDPEINETGSNIFAVGGDFLQGEFNTQPPLRTISLRFDLKF